MKKLLSFVAAAAVTTGGFLAMGGQAGAADVGAPGVKGSGGAIVIAPLNPQQKLVAFWCAAAATVIAASTSVEYCHLYADDEFVTEAESISLSGQAAATAGLAAVDSLTSTLKVCWRVSSDPILGPPAYDEGCTTVNTAVIAV